MPERAYLSIGEVLALLKDEFADITISKIRFLESQGLIDPERTPSGYRKFYAPDVERLRWILRQQKEHYLPLRVIKGKLSEAMGEEGEAGPGDGLAALAGSADAPPALSAVPDPPDDASDGNGIRPGGAAPEARARRPVPGVVPARQDRPAGRAADQERSGDETSDQADAEEAGRRPAPPFPESLRRSARTSPAAFLTAPEPAAPGRSPAPGAEIRRAPSPPAATPAASAGRGVEPEVVDEEIELDADELAAASGLPALAVAELERYGLVKGKPGPGGRYYDAAALEVATLAAGFARFGVEARHLKMWKTAADREADFYEQVVTPLRSQRSNKARQQAGANVTELASLGARLHAALVAGAMKRLT